MWIFKSVDWFITFGYLGEILERMPKLLMIYDVSSNMYFIFVFWISIIHKVAKTERERDPNLT